MSNRYLTVKEIWDFIEQIKPGAIQKNGDKYSPRALECLFFVTENQGKRLNDENTIIPRHTEWQRNRKALIEKYELDFASERQKIVGEKKGKLSENEKKQLEAAGDKFIEEKCRECKDCCELRECCIHPGEEPPDSFREQLTLVLSQAIELRDMHSDNRSDKDIILEFLNKKKFQKASKEIQKLKEDSGDFKKMAGILVSLVNWKESDENAKTLQKINSDFQKQKKQLLLFWDKFNSLGRRHMDQWWKEIADILATAPSAYDDDDLDIREEDAQSAAEEGNYKRANSILSNPDWKAEIKLLERILEEERARCRRYISGQRRLIKNLCINSPSKDEVIKIYEEITYLSEEYQIEYSIFLEYSEFLYLQEEYSKGIEIADRLNRHYMARKSTPSIDIAKLYIQFGELYYANQEYKESIRFCEDAKEILEKAPYKYVTERVRLYNTMSDNYWRIHHSNEAINYAKNALKLFERYNKSVNQLTDKENLLWAHTYKRLGTLMRREWNLVEAENYYKEALIIQEKLYGKDPDNDEFAQALAATYSNLGILYRHMKKYDEGEKYYQQSNDIREKKCRDSDDLNFNWSFAITATNHAYLLACAGRQADAETKMEEIVFPIKKKLLEEYPDSKKYRSSYAFSLKDYGFILSCSDSNDEGKWKRANEKFLESIDLVEQHLTQDSKIPKAYEDLMATINFEYGCLLKKMGKEPEAIIRFRKAFEIYQTLKEDGQYYVHDIGMAALELAELLSRSEDTWAEAEIAYQQALEFGEKIPETSQKYHQDDYVRTLKGLIGILQLEARPEDQLKIKSLKEKLAKYEIEGSVENI